MELSKEELEAISPCDYSYFFKKDEWSEEDVLKLFAPPEDSAALQNLFNLINAGINAKKLKYSRYEDRSDYSVSSDTHELYRIYYFDPFTIIDWAIGKQLPLPEELLEWHDKQSKPKPEEVPSYLDPSHPLHSWELAVAISAWREVLESNPDKPNRGSRKSLVESWLKSHYPKLKQSEIERITTMLNPDKAGGAPKTE